MTSLSWHGSTKIMTSYQMVWCHNRFYLKLWGTVVNQGIWFRGTLSPKNRFVTGAEMNEFFSYYKVEKRFFVKFGGTSSIVNKESWLSVVCFLPYCTSAFLPL